MSFTRLSSALLLSAAFILSAHAQTPAPLPTAAKPAASKPATPSTKPYLTVNNYPIPQSIVDAFIAEQKLRGIDTAAPAFQRALRDEMIRRGALLADAKKRGLDITSTTLLQRAISGANWLVPT